MTCTSGFSIQAVSITLASNPLLVLSRRSLGPHIRSSFYLMLPPSGLLLGFSFLAFLAFLGLGFLDLSLSTEYSLLRLAMLEWVKEARARARLFYSTDLIAVYSFFLIWGMGQADPLLAQKVHLLVRKKLNPGANGISNGSSVSEHAAQTHLVNSLT